MSLVRKALAFWLLANSALAYSGPTCTQGQALVSDPANGFVCTTPVAQKSWLYPTSGTAASGFSTTIPDGITAVAVNATGILLSGSITLPANPADGMPITINCPKSITALSLVPNAGQSVSNNFLPTACGINTPIRVKYYAINSTWYPN